MESRGVILTSSLTSESVERINSERGEWGVTWGDYLFIFSLFSRGLWLSSSHGKFFF